jgi:hypothetical protein
VPWASSIADFKESVRTISFIGKLSGSAIRNGSEKFDFGRSTPGRELSVSAKQWEPNRFNFTGNICLERGSTFRTESGQSEVPASHKGMAATAVALTKVLGPRIVKTFLML